ncbi:nicotinate-nucleotide adenylyltransferase [Luteimonas sp. YGD11-2]|uniref:nicotinate-nucleotide adenylyltransferase n=1 Tax=Luteimonas sp. YGD11-2 TaxID=2508168 RepID=UPI00100A6F9C|nr:nicotinate-nucleotide adenylyltransferase [Luteimonas sp. YGD11-2]
MTVADVTKGVQEEPASLLVLYGGTFDPVHNGHLAVARAARDLLGVPVHLMPAADPPHRAAPGADAATRAAMLDLALAGESGLQVDRRELQRPGRSWTVDTLRALRETAPLRPVALLLGADGFRGLPQWKEWQALFALAHLVVAERACDPLDRDLPAALADAVADRWTADPGDLRATPAGRVLRLRQPLSPESATEVRRRIARGESWQAMVPPAVAARITTDGLYAHGGDGGAPL